jgi:hypothetical protein
MPSAIKHLRDWAQFIAEFTHVLSGKLDKYKKSLAINASEPLFVS